MFYSKKLSLWWIKPMNSKTITLSKQKEILLGFQYYIETMPKQLNIMTPVWNIKKKIEERIAKHIYQHWMDWPMLIISPKIILRHLINLLSVKQFYKKNQIVRH